MASEFPGLVFDDDPEGLVPGMPKEGCACGWWHPTAVRAPARERDPWSEGGGARG